MNSKSSVLNPQQYIESIRSRCDNIQAKGYIKSTNRTIEGLTESIYTEAEKSWIFEILQNIRDSQIEFKEQLPACLVRITLLEEDPFNVGKGCFVISWNECGLTPKNVDGICAVGGSTKVDRSDLIGHKGIGFKAVFSVALQATWISVPTGFVFSLNGESQEDSLSYVVPTWINQRDIPKEIWRVADLVEYNLKWYNCECYPNQTPIKSTEGFIDKPTILCLSISPARFNICKELMTTDRRINSHTITFLEKPDVITTQYLPLNKPYDKIHIISRALNQGENNSKLLTIRTSNHLDHSFSHSIPSNHTTPSDKNIKHCTDQSMKKDSTSPKIQEIQEIQKIQEIQEIQKIQESSDNDMDQVSVYFLSTYKPLRSLPLSVAIDVSEFAFKKQDDDINIIEEERTSKKTVTQWSHTAARFVVNKKDQSGNMRNVCRRPYLYSGLPVHTLRHLLPWAIQGPFILTSNREALQDLKNNNIYLSHIPEALASALTELSGMSTLSLAAIYSVPSIKQIEKSGYTAMVNKEFRSLPERLKEKALIPVGLGENIEWRIGNETTRFDDTFYLALLKLISGCPDDYLTELSTSMIKNNIITPSILVASNAIDPDVLETLGVPPAITCNSLAGRSPQIREVLVQKLLDVISSKVIQWAIQKKICQVRSGFSTNSLFDSTDIYSISTSRDEWNRSLSTLLSYVMWLTVKPLPSSVNTDQPISDRFDIKLCSLVRQRLMMPTESMAGKTDEEGNDIFRVLNSFVYLPSGFGRQKRMEDWTQTSKSDILELEPAKRRITRQNIKSEEVSVCILDESPEPQKTLKKLEMETDSSDSYDAPKRRGRPSIKKKSIDNKMKRINKNVKRSKQIEKSKSPLKGFFKSSSKEQQLTMKEGTASQILFQNERLIDFPFLQSLRIIGKELHPRLLSLFVQPPSDHQHDDRIVDWFKVGLKLESFSIQAFVRDLSQYAKSFVVRRIQESPTILKDAPDELIGTLATLLRFILVNAKDDDMLQNLSSGLMGFPRISNDGILQESSACLMTPLMAKHPDRILTTGFRVLLSVFDPNPKQHTPWPIPQLHDRYMYADDGNTSAALQYAKEHEKRWNEIANVEDAPREYFINVSRALRLIDLCNGGSSPDGMVELKLHRQLLEVKTVLKINFSQQQNDVNRTYISTLAESVNVSEDEFEKGPVWKAVCRKIEQFKAQETSRQRRCPILQLQVTDFRVFPFIRHLKESFPETINNNQQTILLKFLRWMSKVCAPEGHPNVKEAIVQRMDVGTMTLNIGTHQLTMDQNKVNCPSSFWFAIISSPLYIYESIQLKPKDDTDELMVDENKNNLIEIEKNDPPNKWKINSLIVRRLSLPAELTLEIEEFTRTQSVFKDLTRYVNGYSARFIFLGKQHKAKLKDFLSSVGVLCDSSMKDIVAKLTVLRLAVEQINSSEDNQHTVMDERVLSEELKDLETLMKEKESKRRFQIIHPLTDSDDNTRRLKHYIIALYRSIGSHLKSKVSFKSGLDADTFHVQSGFSKNRLAFVKGAFCTPESLVWTMLDNEYKHDPDITFLFESILKVPRTFSLKTACKKYLSQQQRYMEWNTLIDGSLDKRNQQLEELQQTFKQMCLLVQEALSSSMNPTIDWTDELRNIKILSRIPSSLISSKGSRRTPNINQTKDNSINSAGSNTLLSSSISGWTLLLLPIEHAFYFNDITDFQILKNQIEGAAFTEEEIFNGSIHIYQHLGLISHEDLMSMRTIALPLMSFEDNIKSRNSILSESWDIVKIIEALLAQLLAEDKVRFTAVAENGSLRAILSPTIDQIPCSVIVHQYRMAVSQIKRLQQLLSTPEKTINLSEITDTVLQSYNIWFTKQGSVHFDPFTYPPRFFWSKGFQNCDLIKVSKLDTILDSVEDTIGNSTLNFIENANDVFNQWRSTDIDLSIYIIPRIFSCLANFLGLPSGHQISVFTKEAINSLADSLQSNYGFSLASLQQTSQSFYQSSRSEFPPSPSSELDSKRWSLLIEASCPEEKHSTNIYLETLALKPLNEEEFRECSVVADEIQSRLLMSSETNPGATAAHINRQRVGRITDQENKNSRRGLLAIGRTANEKNRFKKMQFTEIAGISTLSANTVEVMKAFRKANAQSKRLKGGAAAHPRTNRYTFSVRRAAPHVYGFQTSSKSSNCSMTVRFLAPGKSTKLLIKIIKLENPQDSGCKVDKGKSLTFNLPEVEHINPEALLVDETLEKSTKQFTLDRGIQPKMSYGVYIGAAFEDVKRINGSTKTTSISIHCNNGEKQDEKEHEKENQNKNQTDINFDIRWSQTVFTARLPSPYWLLDQCKTDFEQNVINLSWNQVQGADRYLIVLSNVSINKGFLFWNVNAITRQTSCCIEMTETFITHKGVIAQKVIALTDDEVVNPQSHRDDTHIDIDHPSERDEKWVIKTKNKPILKIPERCMIRSSTRVTESLNTKTEEREMEFSPTWSWWLHQKIEPEINSKLCDNEDGEVDFYLDQGTRRRRVRPTNLKNRKGKNKAKSKGEITDEDESPNPWIGYRSNPSDLLVLFPSGYKHVCTTEDDSEFNEILDERIALDGFKEIDDEHFDSLAKETLRHIKLDDSDVAEVSVSIELRKASNVLGQLQDEQSAIETQLQSLLCCSENSSVPCSSNSSVPCSSNSSVPCSSNVNDEIKNFLNGDSQGLIRLKNHPLGASFAYVELSSSNHHEKRRTNLESFLPKFKTSSDPKNQIYSIRRFYFLPNHLLFYRKCQPHKMNSNSLINSTYSIVIGYELPKSLQHCCENISMVSDSTPLKIIHLPPNTNCILKDSNNLKELNIETNQAQIFICQSFLFHFDASFNDIHQFNHIAFKPVPVELWNVQPIASSIQSNDSSSNQISCITGLDWKSEHESSSKTIWTIGIVLGSGCGLLEGVREICDEASSEDSSATTCVLQFVLREAGINRPMNSTLASIDLSKTQDILGNTTMNLSDIREGLGGCVCPGTTRCLMIGTPEIDRTVADLINEESSDNMKILSPDSVLPSSIIKKFSLANRRQLQTTFFYAKTLLPEYIVTEFLPSAHYLKCDVASVMWSGFDLHRLIALGYNVTLQMSDLLAVHSGCLQRRRLVLLASRYDVIPIASNDIQRLNFPTSSSSLFEVIGDLGPPTNSNVSRSSFFCNRFVSQFINLPLAMNQKNSCSHLDSSNDHVSSSIQHDSVLLQSRWSTSIEPLLTLIPADLIFINDIHDISKRTLTVRETLRILGFQDSYNFLIDTTFNEPIQERHGTLVNACPPPMSRSLLRLIIHRQLPTPSYQPLTRKELAEAWDQRTQLFDQHFAPPSNGIQTSDRCILRGKNVSHSKFWDTIKKTCKMKVIPGISIVDNKRVQSSSITARNGKCTQKLSTAKLTIIEEKINLWDMAEGSLCDKDLDENPEIEGSVKCGAIRRSIWEVDKVVAENDSVRQRAVHLHSESIEPTNERLPSRKRRLSIGIEPNKKRRKGERQKRVS